MPIAIAEARDAAGDGRRSSLPDRTNGGIVVRINSHAAFRKAPRRLTSGDDLLRSIAPTTGISPGSERAHVVRVCDVGGLIGETLTTGSEP